MKRLQLIKAATEFAFAHYTDGAVDQVIESATAFKAAGGVDEDFAIWQSYVTQGIQVASVASRQLLPSEVKLAQAEASKAATKPE